MTMTRTPTHHPGDERLLDYAAGAAPEPLALLIATHLAFCPRCRHELGELDMLGGALLDDMPPETMSDDCLDRMLARIERPSPPEKAERSPLKRKGDPSIPAPLSHYLDGTLDELSWRRRGPISEVALMPPAEDHATRLLKIRAGAAAPRHTHRGSELTLVLKGSFTDAHGHYRPGDVGEADSMIEHRPVAGEEEDCVCLTVVDAPLKLTSPLGRLINPFLRM